MRYVLLFWTSLKDVGREREKQREVIPTASRRPPPPPQKKKKKKRGISGCGSFVVDYYQPATSIDRLHSKPLKELTENQRETVPHTNWVAG